MVRQVAQSASQRFGTPSVVASLLNRARVRSGVRSVTSSALLSLPAACPLGHRRALVSVRKPRCPMLPCVKMVE
jgi:hypothetical protein